MAKRRSSYYDNYWPQLRVDAAHRGRGWHQGQEQAGQVCQELVGRPLDRGAQAA